MRLTSVFALCTLLVSLLTACGGGGSAGTASASAGSTEMSAIAQLGEKLFNDPTLSSTGAMSCATCHAASNHHAALDARSVPLGADPGKEAGRQASSLQYLRYYSSFFFANDCILSCVFSCFGRVIIFSL